MPLPYHLLPPLPGFALPRTYAPSPVWAGSTTAPARFVAMPKKAAIKLWHRAREFDRQSHEPGRHGGAVGRTALAVLHALVFDFANFRTGPSGPVLQGHRPQGRDVRPRRRRRPEAPARAGPAPSDPPLCRRLAGRPVPAPPGDQRVRAAAGDLLAGLEPPAEPPAPAQGTWGDPPPLLTGVALAALETDPVAKVAALRTDPGGGLAAALASLGASFLRRRES